MSKFIKSKYFLTAAAIIAFGLTIALGSLYARDRIALNDVLNEADALNFACIDANVKASGVNLDKPKLSKQDGKYVYEINFSTSKAKYSYIIAGNNGDVINSSKESVKQSASPDKKLAKKALPENNNVEKKTKTTDKTTTDKVKKAESKTSDKHYISVDAAKFIALQHSGLDATKVTFEKAVIEKDNDKIIYEVEFFTSDNEYEYEIDAYNGSILSYDIDE